jgi:hypothetical protein
VILSGDQTGSQVFELALQGLLVLLETVLLRQVEPDGLGRRRGRERQQGVDRDSLGG